MPTREHLTKEIVVTLGGVRFENALITGDRDERSADFTIYVWGQKADVDWEVGTILEGAIWDGNDGLYCCVKVDEIRPRGDNGWVRARTLLRLDLSEAVARRLWPVQES